MRSFTHVQTGDTVTRLLGGVVPHTARVSAVDERFIYIGGPHGWKFHRGNGLEVDEELGWDGLTKTGSLLAEHSRL